MFNKILNRLKNEPVTEEDKKYIPLFESIEKCILKTESYIYSHTRLPYNNCEDYQKLKKLPAGEKIEALLALGRHTNKYEKKGGNWNSPHYKIYHVNTNLLDAFMRTRLEFPKDFSFLELYSIFYYQTGKTKKYADLIERPFGCFVTQIEKQVKKHGLDEHVKNEINEILKQPAIIDYLQESDPSGGWGPDVGKAVKKLQNLLYAQDGDGKVQTPPYQLGSGRFGTLVKHDIDALPANEQDKWHALFHHLSTASAGKPSKKFLDIANPLVDAIGTNSFKTEVNKWLKAAACLEVESVTHTSSYSGGEYTYDTHEYIETYISGLIKGLLWSMSRFHGSESLQTIAHLVEKCFQKIPGQGPAAAGVGNAGIYTLAQSKGLAGISHLSRLKLRIRQNNTQKLIQKYISMNKQVSWELNLPRSKSYRLQITVYPMANVLRRLMTTNSN